MFLRLWFFVFLAGAFCLNDLAAKELLKVYTRPGCPHCADAKVFLEDFAQKHQDLEIVIFDIWENPQHHRELVEYAREHNVQQVAVPFFVGPKGHLLGFGNAQDMEQKILDLFHSKTEIERQSSVKLPWIGEIETAKHTPLFFTVTIGLIDGFNPCAMWVLLILLSLLVHLKDRRRIFLISSIFVLVSGAIYFLFMSSLLLFYDFIGISRSLQLVIALFAFLIGVVHLKDFFWFKEGLSFSISDGMKTQIARRASKIVRGPSLWAALFSAALLAVFVNLVELMCTAGLPALYTQILAQNNITGMERIFFLLLYTLFYMLDDAVMVFMAVWTLTQTRLQERAGRWLKLVSGLVLVILAVMMIFYPNSLSF